VKGLIAFLILVVLSAWLIVANAAADSVNVKLGVAEVICEGVNATPVVSLSYEFNRKFKHMPELGLELGAKGYSTKLHDTQVEHAWLVGKEMGVLNTLGFFATLKVYLPYKTYVGVGVDYLDNYFIEDSRIYPEGYIIDADIDDDIGFHLTAGWGFAEDWFIETEFLIADIDVESNIFPEGILEARSRFNNYTIMVGKKIRF